MRHPIIGLMGKKRSGKDTLAGFLVERHGFRRFAFADPLKEAVLATNPIVPTPDRLGGTRLRRLADVIAEVGWEAAKENREVRRLLQEYGVAIRAIRPDFWVRATLDPATEHDGPVVITDVRFPNEAEEVRRAGGLLVRIHRPDLVSTDTHVSETALDDFEPDMVVVNEALQDMPRHAAALASTVALYL